MGFQDLSRIVVTDAWSTGLLVRSFPGKLGGQISRKINKNEDPSSKIEIEKQGKRYQKSKKNRKSVHLKC